VSFEATELKALVEGVRVAGREVDLDDAGEALVDSFNACVEFEATRSRTADTLSDEALATRADALHRCRPVGGDAVDEPLRSTDAELSRRRGIPQTVAATSSFEDALKTQAPKLRLALGSADLARLGQADALNGQAVVVEGVAGAWVTDELVVVTVGEQQVVAQLSAKLWKAELPNGTRLELVGVMAGWQAVEPRKLPLVRVLGARRRF
jgi:hypothetical protein